MRVLLRGRRHLAAAFNRSDGATLDLRGSIALNGGSLTQLRSAQTEAASTPPKPSVSQANQQKAETAKAVSNWFMLPWERRQMDGERVPLHTWEKAYWWIFVGGLTYFLFSWARGTPPASQKDKEANAELEERKREMARAVLAGGSVTSADVDPFDGFTPRQIERFVQETTGASAEDPYEGMSPEEINAYVEKHGN